MDKVIELLDKGCIELGISLEEKQKEQFITYLKFLQEKSQVMNLTAIHETEEIVIKHFLDSLTIARLVEDKKKLIDIGTGAGFPGMPLKIYHSGLNLTLLDSLQKRINFLQELARLAALSGIEYLHGRAEDYGKDPIYREQFDHAVSRAVADLVILAEYCLPFVKVGGQFIALKGPSSKEELERAKKALSLLGGELKEEINCHLPLREDERNILIIQKTAPTPAKYPRRAGVPQKKRLC